MDTKIRVFAIHPWMKDKEGIIKHLHIKDEDINENLVVDMDNPKYVIASEHIYKDPYSFRLFKKLAQNQDRIFIFYGGEAVYPDLNIFDYAIGFSRDTVDNGRVSRIPILCFFENTMIRNMDRNELTREEAKRELLKRKNKFCNFMYSNALAHPMRDTLFYEISEYKQVESTGKHLNNTGVTSTRENKNWAKLSVEIKKPYKFVIAAENAAFEGYTSEKIITSFQAHAIPIYWGNPIVNKDFNPEAYINVGDFENNAELIRYIEEVDNNDELWADIVSAPWQTAEQIEKMKIEDIEYQCFIKKIFMSPNKIMRPAGTFIDVYEEWFYRQYKKPSIVQRSIKKIRRMLER